MPESKQSYKSCLPCRNWKKIYLVYPVSLTTCPKNLHDAVRKMSKEIIGLIALHLEQKTTCNILDISREYKYPSNVWVAPSKRCLRACAKSTDSDSYSSYTCAKSHPCICSPFIQSIVSYDSVSGQRMRRLIWAFIVRICPKTCFAWHGPYVNIIFAKYDK